MRLTNPGIWIGILSTLGVVALAVRDFDKAAPGDLAAVHGRMEELVGSENCNKCHGGWGKTMADACLQCHETIGGQIEDQDGLHGELGLLAEPVCGLCHGEHHGSSWSLVNAQSFAMSGAGSMEEFDHELVGFRMVGKHLDQDCTVCHEHAADEVLVEGTQRFGGLDQSCTSCHEDFHGGRMVIDCTSCHGQESFLELEAFGHEEFLPLEGGHEVLDCAECHSDNTDHALRLIGQGRFEEEERSCLDCHDQPHRRPFLREVASFIDAPVAETCSTCHLPEHHGFFASRASVTDELHALTSFELDAPHDEAACRECHDVSGEDFGMGRPERSARDCAVCHEDPHEEQFDGQFGEPQDCIDCHSPDAFEPHAFSLEMHADTELELLDSHLDLDCHGCHQDPEEGEVRAFASMESACETCHEDGHQTFFKEYLESIDEERFDARAELANAAGCELCHEATSFSEFLDERFDHESAAGLAIAGAHAQTDCDSCHLPSEDPDSTGRSFGWVSDHFGTFEGCVTCHGDPHQGQFDGAEFPSEVEGQSDCARCHDASSFRMLKDSFVHGNWTEFPLDGRHAEVGCSACHEPLARPDEVGRTWGRAVGLRCADCHEDPHANQFLIDDEVSCERCHESASAFPELVFEHDRDSTFELGQAHADLECGVCHPSVPTSMGFELVRYRPLDSECVDCHGVQRDRRLLGGKRDE